jgi:hypothetical protein
MFDRIGDAAEKLASNVSRRGFLGSVGRWAGAAALGLAGLVVSAKEAKAGKGIACCFYACSGFNYQLCNTACAPTLGTSCVLLRVTYVPNCKHCPSGWA